MTDEEHELIVKVGDVFWNGLGEMAAGCIASLPEHLETEALYHLQDKCSIFGSDYRRHLPRLRKEVAARLANNRG